MPRVANPYYPSVASGSLPMPPSLRGSYSDSPLADTIASVAGMGLQAAMYDPETDPRRQQARSYAADADKKERENRGVTSMADVFQNMDFSKLVTADPATVGRSVQSAYVAAIEAGAKPKDIATTFQNIMAASGGSESAIRRANPKPLGKDQSYTTEGQQGIADRDQGYAMDKLGVEEDGRTTRNSADNARALRQTEIEEGGRMDRRYDTPVNSAPSNTVYFSPGDPRAPAGASQVTSAARPETMDQVMADLATRGDYAGLSRVAGAKRAAVPMDVGAPDLKGINEAIVSMIPEGATLPKDLQTALATRTAELYQESRNMQAAVTKAWQELTDGETGEGWFDGAHEVKPRVAAPPAGGGQPITEQEYNALPNGAEYTAPDGSRRIKGAT